MEQLQPYMPMIIQAIAGAVGGNVIGALRRTNSFGPLVNTLLGVAGGVGAAQGVAAGGMTEQVLALLANNANVADGVTGLAGGLILPLVASFFKRGS